MLCKNPCSAVFAALLALILVSGALMRGTGGSGSSSGGAKYPSGSLLNGDYSTVLDNDLPPGAHKDFINYQDNDQDKAALHAALSWLTPDAAAALRQGRAVQVYNNTSGYAGAAAALTSALGLRNPTLQGGNAPGGATYYLVNEAGQNAGQTVKYEVLFAAPRDLDLADAMQQVADRVDRILEALPDSNAPDTPAYSYRYVVSTSVDTADAPAADGSSVPATFISVSITRVPTAGS